MKTKLTYLSVRVPEKLGRLIESKAARDGVAKSDIVRLALTRYLVEEQSGAGDLAEGADLQAISHPSGRTPPAKGAA